MLSAMGLISSLFNVSMLHALAHDVPFCQLQQLEARIIIQA